MFSMRMMVAPRVSANSFQIETSRVCLGDPKQKSVCQMLLVNSGEGSKNKYLRHQKNIYILYCPGIPCFLWPLQQFGEKTKHFCGICIVLEVEPLARKVFAGHWTQKSSIRRARRCRFDSTCNTLEFEFLMFDGCFETYIGLKFVYVWFGG